MIVRRGGIFYANLGKRAAIKKDRRYLVVQNDLGNRYSDETIVVAIRHDTRKALPVHVAVPKGVAGMTKDSVVDCGKIATIPKNKLGKFVSQLPAEYMRQVDNALKASLELA